MLKQSQRLVYTYWHITLCWNVNDSSWTGLFQMNVVVFKVLCFMLDHKLLEEMDFRLPPLMTLHLYLFAPQSRPRWKSLQQHLPPSLSRHLALGAWIHHQAHLDRRRLQYPCLQSFNPQLLRSSRTPPCFDSFSQHFRLPCSSTTPVWTWQKSTKVRRNRFKSRLTYSTVTVIDGHWLQEGTEIINYRYQLLFWHCC